MPQERYNTQWVRENHVGLVLPNFRHLRQAVNQMASQLDEFRARIANVQNCAVFEIPQILAGILDAQQSPRRVLARCSQRNVAYH
jgi:1,2-diacylglycerol 3-beta-galactosyltransferase